MNEQSQTQAIKISNRQLLANVNFRALWLGQAISKLGDKFTEIAIPVLIFQLTGSAMQLGIAFISQTVAGLAFGLVAGVLSDRWDRRRTMIGSDLIRALLILFVPAVVLAPLPLTAKLIVVYGLGFVMAAVKQFFEPAKMSTIPDLVKQEELTAANSLDQATSTLITFVGYSAAGAIVAWAGTTWAFVIDGFTFFLSAFCILFMHIPLITAADAAPANESLWQGIAAGLRFAWTHPLLRTLIILSLIAPLSLGAINPLLLIFSHDVLHAGDFGFGVMEAAFGLGLAVGVLLIGRVADKMSRGFLLTRAVVGIGLFHALTIGVPLLLDRAVSSATWLLLSAAVVFFFLTAVSNGALMLAIRTIVQENAPRSMIGRIYNVVMVVSSGAITAGAAFSGLADRFPVGSVMLFWTIFLAVVGLIASLWYPLKDKISDPQQNIPIST